VSRSFSPSPLPLVYTSQNQLHQLPHLYHGHPDPETRTQTPAATTTPASPAPNIQFAAAPPMAAPRYQANKLDDLTATPMDVSDVAHAVPATRPKALNTMAVKIRGALAATTETSSPAPLRHDSYGRCGRRCLQRGRIWRIRFLRGLVWLGPCQYWCLIIGKRNRLVAGDPRYSLFSSFANSGLQRERMRADLPISLTLGRKSALRYRAWISVAVDSGNGGLQVCIS